MDLKRRIQPLVGQGDRSIPPLSAIEDRARRRRRRARSTGALGALVVAATVGLGVVLYGGSTGDRTLTPGIGAAVDNPIETEPPCDEQDQCGAYDEQLPNARQWLGDRLTDAGVEYIDGYRPDGGGGHVNRRWGFQIWVLRDEPGTAETEAARWKYEPLWTTRGITVYGRARPDSPVAYFYWRAGATDTFAELDWPGSEAQEVDDLRDVFGRIIEAQENNPYGNGG